MMMKKSAVEDVDWRTASNLIAKKVANLSAVWSLQQRRNKGVFLW